MNLKDEFIKHFGSGEVELFFAPGRVNIIGEHIDYNGGYVFPCAITPGTYAAYRRRNDGKISLVSANFEPRVDLPVLEFNNNRGWANYPLSIAKCLHDDGEFAGGFEMFFYGDLPNGAGLSSSASMNMVTAIALNKTKTPIELAQLCQRAENLCGVNCGIMDPFASAMGKKDHAILLDCASLEYEHIPFKLVDATIIITNTNKRRGLADSKYNERRTECGIALSDLVGVNNLCDMSVEQFEAVKGAIKSRIVRNRAEHAVYENMRTKKAAELLKKGDFIGFGKLLWESHDSLKNLYEVSCYELDVLVDAAMRFDEKTNAVYGSRMTGAGFGGCTVSILKNSHVDEFISFCQAAYEQATNLQASFYQALPGDGAGRID